MIKVLATIMVFASIPLFALEHAGAVPGDDMQTSYSSETIRIHLSQNGTITLNDSDIDLELLKTFFQEDPKNPDDLVLIIADKNVSKADVLKILDICCNYKYNNVQLVYEPSWIKS